MRIRAAALIAASAVLTSCASAPDAADPGVEAAKERAATADLFKSPSSYEEALQLWRGADDINAWIGAEFRYDMPRAMQLSETQRKLNGSIPILSPENFFATPHGVCVDLARFAVETLRVIDPASTPRYVMIEFDPVSVTGNVLRRHWLVSFERDGMHYFFADSKRPGHIAGPYGSVQEFMVEYARVRERQIISFRQLESYERKSRTPAAKRSRAERR
jgi:hypothetical protein